MNIDHINIKIFARQPYPADLGDAIPVFHHWIQDQILDELMIDVADYRHIPGGPGVMLVGDAADYRLDQAFGRLGLLYHRKRPAQGSLEDKLRDAFASAIAACQLLEEDPMFRGKLGFDAGQCEVIINDRLLAPNTDETWQALKPDLERFFNHLYGENAYTLEHVGERRERFRVAVRGARSIDVSSQTTTAVASSSRQGSETKT
jgi:hypothetical protein